MPIYEYLCSQCEHQLEKLQKLSDQALVQCPECGQDSLQRIMSAAGFQLKGTGWYETDFKHKDKQSSHNQKEQSSQSESGSSASSETTKQSTSEQNTSKADS